jgi:hypothetical protein
MNRTPKHLQGIEETTLNRMQNGINRFRFGFAEPGEELDFNGYRYRFVGNFQRRHMAQKAKEENPPAVAHSYTKGRHSIGWAVWQMWSIPFQPGMLGILVRDRVPAEHLTELADLQDRRPPVNIITRKDDDRVEVELPNQGNLRLVVMESWLDRPICD